MKVISALFLLIVSINTFSQNNKDGYFKTYEDYLNNNLKEEAGMDWVGRKVTVGAFYVYFTDKNRKDKIKDNPNWGCKIGNLYYRFYDGTPYEIRKSGKIMLYLFQEGTHNQKAYSKGDHKNLTLFTLIHKDDFLANDIFSEDKEMEEMFKTRIDDSWKLQGMNYVNLETFIDQYNVKHK